MLIYCLLPCTVSNKKSALNFIFVSPYAMYLFFLLTAFKILSSSLLLRNMLVGTSLVVQWLRICLPMQWTWVRALVQEHPTCHGATKPVRHNYWACVLELMSQNYWAHEPQLLMPACLELCSATREATTMRSPCTTVKNSPSSPQLKKAPTQQWRPNAAKN